MSLHSKRSTENARHATDMHPVGFKELKTTGQIPILCTLDKTL